MWRITINDGSKTVRYLVQSASRKAAIGKALQRYYPDGDEMVKLTIEVEVAEEGVLEE